MKKMCLFKTTVWSTLTKAMTIYYYKWADLANSSGLWSFSLHLHLNLLTGLLLESLTMNYGPNTNVLTEITNHGMNVNKKTFVKSILTGGLITDQIFRWIIGLRNLILLASQSGKSVLLAQSSLLVGVYLSFGYPDRLIFTVVIGFLLLPWCSKCFSLYWYLLLLIWVWCFLPFFFLDLFHLLVVLLALYTWWNLYQNQSKSSLAPFGLSSVDSWLVSL